MIVRLSLFVSLDVVGLSGRINGYERRLAETSQVLFFGKVLFFDGLPAVTLSPCN